MRHGLEVGNCEAVLEGSSVRVEEDADRVKGVECCRSSAAVHILTNVVDVVL